MVKRIILGIVIVLVVAVAAVLGLAATRPDTFRVARTATIKAPPEKVFALVGVPGRPGRRRTRR